MFIFLFQYPTPTPFWSETPPENLPDLSNFQPPEALMGANFVNVYNLLENNAFYSGMLWLLFAGFVIWGVWSLIRHWSLV